MADYAISNVARRVVYAPSGVGPYAFTFEILTSSDIAVYRGSTLLTLTTDYSVTINANGTGSVTLVATAGTSNITIVGAKTIQRTTDFTTGGDFFANTINDELDAQTIFIQQVAETAERGLKAPVIDPTDINMTLPSKASRAGKTLAFDADGNPAVGEDIGNWRGDWVAGTSYTVRDLVRDASNQNVYRCNTAHTSTGTTPISSNVDVAKWDIVIAVSDLNSLVDDAEAAQVAAEAAQAAAEAAQAAAETAETNAETAETNAETAATNASNSATAAASSASTASTAATNAGNSATAAATSATNASNSASAASTSASNASTSATNAASSATSASGSASTATTQATNASNSASAASTSASNAATSASNAATSATAAQTAQTAAEAALDAFTDIYLGAFSSDPTLDNDGDALTAGDLYFNTVSNRVKVYSGSAWGFVSVDPALVVEKTGETGSAKLPAGTTGERDGSPAAGFLRFNSTLAKPEIYNGSAWGSVGGGATGGGSDDIFIENGQTVTTNYTLSTGKNAGSFGPITIDSGVTVTVPSGQVWTIV